MASKTKLHCNVFTYSSLFHPAQAGALTLAKCQKYMPYGFISTPVSLLTNFPFIVGRTPPGSSFNTYPFSRTSPERKIRSPPGKSSYSYVSKAELSKSIVTDA